LIKGNRSRSVGLWKRETSGTVPKQTGHLGSQLTYVPTSYVERENLTIRAACRRFTPLTNAATEKFDNLKAAPSLPSLRLHTH